MLSPLRINQTDPPFSARGRWTRQADPYAHRKNNYIGPSIPIPGLSGLVQVLALVLKTRFDSVPSPAISLSGRPFPPAPDRPERCFCSFVDRFVPNMFATAPEDAETRGGGAFVVLETHLVLLELLLRFHDPVLASHLDKCCVSPAVYATPWWVCFFLSGPQEVSR